MHDQTTPITSGNYYTWGTKRVLAKLIQLGVHVPEQALKHPDRGMREGLSPSYTYLEHAVMDWFDDRDYTQAQGLIHYRPARGEWHVIEEIDGAQEYLLPEGVTPGMLCPTLLDALAAVIDGCDRDLNRLAECRKEGDSVVVVIEGKEALRINPVRIEPFDLAKRDRVRQTFKGVRQKDSVPLLSGATRLPGFKGLEAAYQERDMNPNLGMLLGFPGNWAYAMRNALKQVGIEVKLSLAQELAAVLFGASDWHQIVKHQDEVNDSMAPVAMSLKTAQGWQRRYFQTTEEAIFGTGNILKNYHEPVVIDRFDLSLDHTRVIISAVKRSDFEARKDRFTFVSSCIKCGGNDYWSLQDDGAPKLMKSAMRLLARINEDRAPTAAGEVLYGKGDTASFLEEILAREGIPADQLVYVGDCALAVYYRPEPNGTDMQTAWLRVFKIEESRPQRIGDDIPMYKAKVSIAQSDGGKNLLIKPDYGNGEPIVIPISKMSQVRQLLSKTHHDDLFYMIPPNVDFTEHDSTH